MQVQKELYENTVNLFNREGESKLATFFALSHLTLFVVFYLNYVFFIAGKAQDALVWICWLFIDFPISLLTPMALMVTSLLGGGNTMLGVFIIVIHGWLGTLWWYYLVKKVVGLARKI